MLACVAAVGRLPSPSRAGELARHLTAMLSADAATVDRARPTGLLVRLAAVGNPPPDDGPPGDVAAADPDAQADTARVTRAGGADARLTSTWAGAGRPTVLRVWRRVAFGDAEAAAVALLHPHVGPMLVAAPPAAPSGITGAILELMLDGLPEKQIAERLDRNAHTVHAYVKRVYKLFGVNSRSQLILRCRG